MKKFLEKLFKRNTSTKSPIENNGENKVTSEETNEISIDDVISEITFEKAKSQYYNTTNFDLEDELNSPEDYDDLELDEDTKSQINELKSITESIDLKVTHYNTILEDRTYKIDYKKELNLNQLAAIAEINNPLLVIAGAGSGKTRVITYKVSYLIENGFSPSEILLLTFTRKAANEMLERVQKIMGDKTIGGVLGGTFHGFSNYALRRYGKLIGIQPNFTIVDTGDSEDIIDLLKTEFKFTGKKNNRPFPKKAKIQSVISKSKNLEYGIEKTIEKYYGDLSDFVQELTTLNEAYSKYKKASNLFDYDDLMIQLRNYLKENKVFRSRLQSTIKYILVDEYQDTNNIQREIVELLAKNDGKVTVVGDDAQSIYSFRGANFENILRFPQSFPDCKVVKLEENYRSEQGILDFSNDIILHSKIGFRKSLYSSRSIGKKPTIKRFPDSTDEAEFIVDKVLEIKSNDLEYSDFAVLTRASWHSNYVQAELIKRNIPFIVVGGIKFSERRHVKDIIALLKIVINPLDAVAWHRSLKLIEGIGKIRAKEIVSVVHGNNGLIDFNCFSKRKYYPHLKKLENLFLEIQDKQLALGQIIHGFYKFYKPLLKQIEDDFENREKDLDIFLSIAEKYSELDKFLADFTLEPPSNRFQDDSTPLMESDEKPLTVSTIHSAKGLEWHTVFIPFALDGLLPSSRSLGTLQEIEEERRLFYVASSRAKENLYVTMPSYVASWDAYFTKPCRFIAEVDKNNYLIEK